MQTAQRLNEWLAEVRGCAFDWADWHCGHFAADWVRFSTGHRLDLGLQSVGDPRGWARALADAGGMKAHLLRHTGARALPSCLAQVGDVVMLPGRVVPEALGVCVGGHIACVGTPAGVAMRPLADGRACWRLADLVARAELQEAAP